MIGFNAKWVEGEISVDGVELSEANWYTVDTLPSIPGKHTIAGRIIRKWIESKRQA